MIHSGGHKEQVQGWPADVFGGGGGSDAQPEDPIRVIWYDRPIFITPHPPQFLIFFFGGLFSGILVETFHWRPYVIRIHHFFFSTPIEFIMEFSLNKKKKKRAKWLWNHLITEL